MRNIYKNKYLQGRGLTASQISEVMRKMKVYLDRLNDSPLNARLDGAEKVTQVKWILDCIFNNEWKGYIKESYKDMPYYFRDYAKFLQLVADYSEGKKPKWPDGTPVKAGDILGSTKSRHNHIRMMIDGEQKEYPSINALRDLCLYIGCDEVAKANYSTGGEKLLLKYVPLGKEKRYMDIGNGWHLCTMGESKTKLRLINVISNRFHLDVHAELV